MSLKTQRFALTILLATSMLMHLVYGLEGVKQMGELEYKLERQGAKLLDKEQQIEVLEIMLEHEEEVKKEVKEEK